MSDVPPPLEDVLLLDNVDDIAFDSTPATGDEWQLAVSARGDQAVDADRAEEPLLLD